jgi:hypothetical protein
MPSSKQLVFDRTKFDKYIKGDLGIADKIHQEEVVPIINKAYTPQDKALLQELINPNKKTGLWAVEKSFIATSFELQKPIIELNKHYLELLGHLEYIVACISGGPNPFNLSTSYAYAFKQNIADMSKFKTGFEPASLNSAAQTELPPPILPEQIFLGRFNSVGQPLGPDSADQGRFALETGNKIWPQYQSYDQFTNEQTELISQETIAVEEPYRSDILNSRPESFPDEWDDMESKNQLKQNFAYLPPNLKKYYVPVTTQYQNRQVDIDIEEDYDIDVSIVKDADEVPFYTITAVLKESVRVNILNATNGSSSSQPQLPDPIPSQSYARAAKFFFKKTLKVLLKKYIPVLIKIKQLLAKPQEYVGNILISNMYKYFEMFDQTLGTKPDSDKTKSKYFYNGKFVMDGVVNMNVDKWKVYLNIADQRLEIKSGNKKVPIEQSSTKLLMDLIGLSTNYLNETVDIFSGFLMGLFKVKQIPTLIPGLLSYQSFRNTLLQTKIVSMLGGSGVNLLTIPAWLEPPSKSNDMERSFKRLVTMFINGFIEMPNIIFNQQLAQKLTIPT